MGLSEWIARPLFKRKFTKSWELSCRHSSSIQYTLLRDFPSCVWLCLVLQDGFSPGVPLFQPLGVLSPLGVTEAGVIEQLSVKEVEAQVYQIPVGVSKSQGPYHRPRIVRHVLQGYPQKGPPIYRDGHVVTMIISTRNLLYVAPKGPEPPLQEPHTSPYSPYEDINSQPALHQPKRNPNGTP